VGPVDDAQQSAGAALGTAWAHAVNIRIILERLKERRVLQVGAWDTHAIIRKKHHLAEFDGKLELCTIQVMRYS
jgi:hypothetical protein